MSAIVPGWDVPGVRALVTTQAEGNLALHAGDVAMVQQNRRRLAELHKVPGMPIWMSQVHGVRVLEVKGRPDRVPTADAAYTRLPRTPLVVMVADCLPIFVADEHGCEVAVIHAGWRGLAAGIIEKTIQKFESGALVAWIGPGIMQCHYEVDAPVVGQFDSIETFCQASSPGHWMIDLPGIASRQLARAGVNEVRSSEICTGCDSRFFSHRRDDRAGRFAAVIWKE